MSVSFPTPGAIPWRRLFFARQGSSRQDFSAASDGAAKLRQFEDFFLRYERQITAYLCRMVGDEQFACDLSQETFIRAWQHTDQIRDPAAARPWLYRIATNLALRFLQQRQARPTDYLPDEWPGASDPGRRIAERDRVQAVLQSLPPKQRGVLLLHLVHGLTCAEVGDLLGMSRDAVKMALWRGREHFRAEYLRGEA